MPRAWILFFCIAALSVQADQRPVLSLVIDDLGHSLQRGKAAIQLDGDHTYAILPGTRHTRQLAQLAHRHNKEVILHLPMQSIGAASQHEPHALDESMSEDQLATKVQSLLAQVPFIRGVNNHMGSYLTELDFFMQPVMDSIRAYNPELYFLDSRTSAHSIAHAEALNAGLQSISRDVFLDNESNIESIQLQYQIWLDKARKHGSAIAIGHPHKNTLRVLRQNLSATTQFRFMHLSELINMRRQQFRSLESANQISDLWVSDTNQDSINRQGSQGRWLKSAQF